MDRKAALSTLVVSLLVAVASFQLLSVASSRWVKRVDFAVGEVFPFNLEPYSADRADVGANCHYGFIVSVTCPACGALAHLYADSVRESLGTEDPRPLWFLEEDAASAQSWAVEHELHKTGLLELSIRHRGPLRRPLIGSVWFTPTRVVLSSGDHEVRDIRPSDEFLTAKTLDTLCREGGVAINTPQEGERLLGSGARE